jgi:hypothetical protein
MSLNASTCASTCAGPVGSGLAAGVRVEGAEGGEELRDRDEEDGGVGEAEPGRERRQGFADGCEDPPQGPCDDDVGGGGQNEADDPEPEQRLGGGDVAGGPGGVPGGDETPDGVEVPEPR